MNTFPDGAGWNLEDDKAPYYYEHIAPDNVDRLEYIAGKQLYKIVCVVPLVDQPHKNTYFVKGKFLREFLLGFCDTGEYVVSISQVDNIPPHYKPLKEE